MYNSAHVYHFFVFQYFKNKFIHLGNDHKDYSFFFIVICLFSLYYLYYAALSSLMRSLIYKTRCIQYNKVAAVLEYLFIQDAIIK